MRKTFYLICLLLIPLAFAKITMIKPFYAELSNNQTLNINTVQPNETLLLIFARRGGSIRWNDVSAYPKLIADKAFFERAIELKLKIPEKETFVRIKFSDSETGIEEFFTLHILPRTDLISATLPKSFAITEAFSDANYELLIINKSLAEHCVLIRSSLPEYSFTQHKACIAPLNEKRVTVSVHALMPSTQEFSFYVDSAFFSKKFAKLKAMLKVKPNALSKLRMPFFAFPLNIQLPHAYLLNALLSLI